MALIEKGIADLPINTKTIYRSPARAIEEANDFFNEAVVGKELVIPDHLQSYSLLAEEAARRSRKSDVLFRIESPTKGALMEAFSRAPSQREVLLPSGLRYKVTAKGKPLRLRGRNFRVVDLEIIN